MYAVRLWSIRNARLMERIYAVFEPTLRRFHPLLKKIGYDRLEGPMEVVERNLKGFLFDCQMCGQCALSSTGMSCPMNCPKSLRNGPCGGVRLNGHCEVKPAMKCVWVQAWEGSRRMAEGDKILEAQKPVDHSLKGTSAWLRRTRELAEPGASAAAGGAQPAPAKKVAP